MQRPVRGFVTVCCIGNYRRVFLELLHSVLESRLYEASSSLELAVLGPAENHDFIAQTIRPFEKIRVSHGSERIDEYEFPALVLLQSASRSGNCDVYYLHTKGVSHGETDQHARHWRQLMLHHVVESHNECRRALRGFDAVGTNWRGNHYSGNFWWARSEHIRRLPDIRGLQRSPRRISSDPVWNVRLQCEFWIGMARARFKNVGPSGLDLYQTLRWSTPVSQLVSELFQAQAGRAYLEFALEGEGLGVRSQAAAVKHLVSPDARATFAMSDAEFIASGLGESHYDLVLVDSFHDQDRCLSVLRWALARLSVHGAIVVHDSNPPTAWHQRSSRDYQPGTEWNGDVWKAIVRFRLERPDIDVTTVDTDWGCTIIQPSVRARRRLATGSLPQLEWASFEQSRAHWLNLVSVQEFRRDLHFLPFALGHRPITTRTDVINALLSRQRLQRYLEIGVGSGETLAQVIAPVRHGVDLDGSPTFRCSSDEFFAQQRGCAEYDLIFIDGLHEEQQCLRDMDNAFRRLSSHGMLVVHDANPPTEWHQRPPEAHEPGTAWNGTVWKAIVRFREKHPESALFTIDIDWGCAVIWRRCPEVSEAPFRVTVDLTWAWFQRNRATCLQLRSVDDFRAQLAATLAAFDRADT